MIETNANGRRWAAVILLTVFAAALPARAGISTAPAGGFAESIQALADLGDRSTGTPGHKAAAEYIKTTFSRLGFDSVGSHTFSVPVRMDRGSWIFLPERNQRIPIHPLRNNAISPETISPEGIKGPLVYAGSGELHDFNGKTVSGAVILMEFDSGSNWLHAASIGAKALIYIDRGNTPKSFYEEKYELSPIAFPRFHLPVDQARALFGAFETAKAGRVAVEIALFSEITWQTTSSENIYCLVPGSDPELSRELVIVEAFYDSTAMVFGRSPGADEACSVASLLELARFLKSNPPARSILLVATAGHAQSLAGMREMIWSLREKSRTMKKYKKALNAAAEKSSLALDVLGSVQTSGTDFEVPEDVLRAALTDRVKTESDRISRQLMHFRMQKKDDANQDIIQQLAQQRLLLRRLDGRSTFKDLSGDERRIFDELVPKAKQDHETVLSAAKKQLKQLKSASRFRSLVKDKTLAAVVSLHLSSHGDGFGAFNQGWFYALKPGINRTSSYGTIDAVLHQAASKTEKTLGLGPMFQDTLRPSRRASWQSTFIDRPPLGGEVSALAGYLGLSLVTGHDARARWGTPYDLPGNMDMNYAARQSAFLNGMVKLLSEAPRLDSGRFPRNGFASVTGRVKLLRQGELFPDQPASGTVILAYQGPGRYYATVDAMGNFYLRGMATRKLTLHKAIIEGYMFDPATGAVVLAIDKKQTGKAAYRLKIQRTSMETDLVMFACKQTTIFNLLEPRNFRYMHRFKLIDGRRETLPMRYWYSRIDTRDSIISSIFLEPGTPLKLTLSDTILQKKMILLNADDSHPEGIGYRVDEWPFIHHTTLRAARDMWTLLKPRIANLENHGIFNEKIRALQLQGTTAMKQSEMSLEAKQYDRYFENAAKSWALASRVYNQVEKTQKDVLFGVLFYIALFVPFAFCAERLLFSFVDIHKRIVAFFGILILLIILIYNVHPAFRLAYSPVVVILAFFIMGLSLVVTLIIFFRFEEEMVLLQQRAREMKAPEITQWKAFAAAFFLGVSNLRRRRIRTVLTCTTLIILTFTIMSFTSVRSLRHHSRILFQKNAPYQGFLLKHAGWNDIPPEALGILSNAFGEMGRVAPRVWLETDDRTRATQVPVRHKENVFVARGVLGLSHDEVRVTGLDQILVDGRWFQEGEGNVVLLPERMAQSLGVDPGEPQRRTVTLWGVPFEVAGLFSGQGLQERSDLDGEPLTPAIFPSETFSEMTEVEIDALESGEDVRSFQGRYQHLSGDLTVIMPYKTLLALGGRFKGVAVRFESEKPVRTTARDLVDRFGLTLFSGEPAGTFVYHASDTINYSGVPNILIPMIISVLIVLNTMIGSVYERKREIGIYTSVGLAPSHVSFLFIAEAMAFAVLSVVLGYLLAQSAASLFGGTSLWAGITVNYSSLSGIGAMVLVILVVLVSVIYPSKVAAEIAMPDIKRSWTIPEPRGNVLAITLPFLMKLREHRSIGGYLLTYFREHQDVSHGLFSTGKTELPMVCPMLDGNRKKASDCVKSTHCEKICLRLSMDMWLAPFDFGIMQRTEIEFVPSAGNPGFLELRVNLSRKAGEANAWLRINKIFLYDLRRQLLTWRSLDATALKRYERHLDVAQTG
ncbi:MAG: M28 family peptidase [Deltaproteobacteria bacterium]|nr:M28 family peptidase [Deltaproteobacteria bacterium]